MNIVCSAYGNKDFQELCAKLDAFQNSIVPERAGFGFTALAELDKPHDVLIVYDDNKPVACGALKKSCEVARVYTYENYRGRGIGKMVMSELEKIAAAKGYSKLVLDT